ncbi:MAG TPA: cupin domain-containing protein [Terriglobales bacterium]|nr:cupin domain-containing protein [Terriglobales bacterium]
MKAGIVWALRLLILTTTLQPCMTGQGIAKQSIGRPSAKVIRLDSNGKKYLPILSGPPESMGMESGLVVLAPGQAVGKHDTKQYEELLIVLAGDGEMVFEDGSKLPVSANSAVYCPPHTEHNVINTGHTALRYIYVAART